MTLSERIAARRPSELHPPTLTHSHMGGTIHNHSHYSAEDMAVPMREHTHTRRDDWQDASPFTRSALAGTLPPKGLDR